ncbi:gluconeogenesis factor YvcK family protein [Liquorilactobacillus capillatus]|uniref:gluconeogenesis factor YvcK family protein n=1 Tax=Liquorilactobacillus capillatus TaxID=480931 RepID=UPI00070E43D0|nr:YvcK family protein [Liquorilactobacillus capillatus]
MINKLASQRRQRPHIVVIGGGTGLPVILRALRKQNADITAVVTVADDGGSSGVIRDYINVVPPGDIRNVLVALSNTPDIYKNIFQYRFKSSDQFFSGHAIGNLIIAALSEMNGDGIFNAVQELAQMMRVDGHVYPAANDPLILNAEFADGTVLAGESEISAADKTIDRVWVTGVDDKQPCAVQEVVDAIMQADQIVLGPGSLFTSILPNLMISNVGKAVCETDAEVIYICNIMTQKGETEHFSDADHVRVLNRHLGKKIIDTVLVNTQPVPDNYMDHQKYDEYLYQVKHDFNGLRQQGCRVISDNFLELRDRGVFHNGSQVVNELMRLTSRPLSWIDDEFN